MTALIVQCDGCGERMSGRYEIGTGDQDFCRRCYLKDQISYLFGRAVDLERWLEETHLKSIRELKEKHDVLLLELRGLEAQDTDTPLAAVEGESDVPASEEPSDAR